MVKNEILVVNQDTQTVSARELHEKLNIETPFKKWVDRMIDYGFEEGKDFWTKMSESTGGRPATEYDISIDMAKQICMIQRTPEGKACRQYLIDLEKAWNTPEQVMARALKIAEQTISSLTDRNKELETTVIEMDKAILDMSPKVDYVDRILSSTDCMTVTQIAQDYGFSAKTFNKILHQAGIQHNVGGQWILYAVHQGQGYVRTKTTEFQKGNGTVGTKPLTVWSQKGRMFIYQKLKEIGIEPKV